MGFGSRSLHHLPQSVEVRRNPTSQTRPINPTRAGSTPAQFNQNTTMTTTATPIALGVNDDLDALYEQLGLLEERECDACEFGRRDLLPEIRQAQIPFKRQINAIEGRNIYDVPA